MISIEDSRDEINALLFCWRSRKIDKKRLFHKFMLIALGRQKYLMNLYVYIGYVFWKSKWYPLKLTSPGDCKVQLWELNLWVQSTEVLVWNVMLGFLCRLTSPCIPFFFCVLLTLTHGYFLHCLMIQYKHLNYWVFLPFLFFL